MAINRSSFYRLIKPIVSSSFAFGDASHGASIGKLKQYHSNTYANGLGVTHPYSLLCPWLQTVPLSELNTKPFPTYYEILGSGNDSLEELCQPQGPVNICQKWGMSTGGFKYKPCNLSAEDYRLHMCFGRNWDPETRYKNPCRSDGSEPPPIPYEFVSLAETSIQDELPSMCPDTCLVSFYPRLGRLGIHQDRDESSESIGRGLPVVSISVGKSAEFLYGHTRDEKKLERVFLDTGDVLIFGGKSRLIYHGVRQILSVTDPPPFAHATALRPGCLNLTMKQF